MEIFKKSDVNNFLRKLSYARLVFRLKEESSIEFHEMSCMWLWFYIVWFISHVFLINIQLCDFSVITW